MSLLSIFHGKRQDEPVGYQMHSMNCKRLFLQKEKKSLAQCKKARKAVSKQIIIEIIIMTPEITDVQQLSNFLLSLRTATAMG